MISPRDEFHKAGIAKKDRKSKSSGRNRGVPLKELSKESIDKSYGAMRESGMSKKESSEIIGCRETSVMSKTLERDYEVSWAKENIEAARKSVLLFVNGQSVNGVDPKPSDILKACEIILDRADPTVDHKRIEQTSITAKLSDREVLDIDNALYLHYKKNGKKIRGAITVQ